MTVDTKCATTRMRGRATLGLTKSDYPRLTHRPCHPERSDGSQPARPVLSPSGRFFASLRMTAQVAGRHKVSRGEVMDVLVTCPSARDRKALAQIPGYTFHLLDTPLNARTPSPECDILDYIERCRQYIRRHRIDAIYYSRDVADLVAAALCAEFGFPGP